MKLRLLMVHQFRKVIYSTAMGSCRRRYSLSLLYMYAFLITLSHNYSLHYLSHIMTKPTKWHVCTSTQSDQSSLCTQWVAKDPKLLHTDSEDSDQTGWMPRLIRVFAGHTYHFDGFVTRWLICYNEIAKALPNIKVGAYDMAHCPNYINLM